MPFKCQRLMAISSLKRPQDSRIIQCFDKICYLFSLIYQKIAQKDNEAIKLRYS